MDDLYEGQDGVMDIHHDAVPPALLKRRVQSERNIHRTTEAVLLRLSPDDALALRLAAKANALNTSTYVARLVATRDHPNAKLVQEDPLADASSVAAALCQIPNEIRRLRGELLKLGGLVKSLFIRSESMKSAQDHAHECSSALIALTHAADKAIPVVARVEDELASIRVELEQLVIRLANDR